MILVKRWLGFINSWSLKQKQLTVLISIFAIVLTLSLGLILSLHTMQVAFDRTIQGDMGLKMSFEGLRRGLLELNRDEKDFFTSGDDFFLESLGQTYDSLKAQVDHIQAKDGPISKETLNLIAEGFPAYKTVFDQAAALHLKIAHPRKGLRNKIRTFMETLEKDLLPADRLKGGQLMPLLAEISRLNTDYHHGPAAAVHEKH